MKNVFFAAIAALVLSACATAPGVKSGQEFSGSFAIVKVASDIPGIPASNGQVAKFGKTERDQILYLDAHCQKELYEQLPGWAQAIVREGGWQALATAVGEGAFASAFPGANVARYMLGGLGFGMASGANTGRIRQEQGLKSAQSYCTLQQVQELKARYKALPGILIVPWVGDGNVALREADKTPVQGVSHVDVGAAPRP